MGHHRGEKSIWYYFRLYCPTLQPTWWQQSTFKLVFLLPVNLLLVQSGSLLHKCDWNLPLPVCQSGVSLFLFKKTVIRYFTDRDNFHCITSYSTCHWAKCECFNVNKMLCLKGENASFIPEQDPQPGHNWTTPGPKLDSHITHITYNILHISWAPTRFVSFSF